MVSAIESNVVVMNQSVREKFRKVSKQIDEQSLLISTECVRFKHGRKIKGVLDMAKSAHSKQIDEQSLLISTQCVRFDHGGKIKGVLAMAQWQNLPLVNRLMSKVY